MSKFETRSFRLKKDAWAILDYLKYIDKDENTAKTLTKALLITNFVKSELRGSNRIFIRTPDGHEKEITL